MVHRKFGGQSNLLNNTTRKLIQYMGHSSDSWTGCFTKSLPRGEKQRDYSRLKNTKEIKAKCKMKVLTEC